MARFHLLFLPLAVAVSLQAQSGLVKSANQAIPGATVTATAGGQKLATTTDQNGHYSLPAAPAGECTIEVQMFGFEKASKKTNCAAAATVDFALQLQESPMAQRMAARAQGGGSALETQLQNEMSSAEVPGAAAGAVGDGQTGNEAFLVSGSLSQGLAPNVRPDFGMWDMGGGQPGGQGNNPPGGQPGANLGGPGGGGFGGSGFGGPGGGGGGFGRGGGGAGGGGGNFRRNAQSRPGAQFGNRRAANQIHGMAYFTLGNSALDAKPFSITGQDVPQPVYANSRFGLLVGGPLVIPHIVKDSSTFFFLNYTGTRSRQPSSFFETVPDSAERLGNFSEALQPGGPVQIFDPTTHAPFPNNVIPPSMLNPVAQKLLTDYFPQPTLPGTLTANGLIDNFQFLSSVPNNSDNVGVRVMRDVAKNDRLAFHLTYQRRDADIAQPFGFRDTSSGYGIQTDLTWTHNFTPRTILSSRVDFNRNRNQTTPYFAFGPDVATQLGLAGASTNPVDFGPPNLNFTNFQSLTDSSPVLTRNQTQKLTESVILSRGKHTLTFGAQYARNDIGNQSEQNGRGTFNFTGIATSQLSADGLPVQGTGSDLGDFLLGLAQSTSIQYSGYSLYFKQNAWNGFALDDWKVAANLTVNLGLRYELFEPFTEQEGRMANLDVAPDFAGVARVTPGVAGPFSGAFPSGLINPDYKNISPRIGIAWKVPFIKKSTIIRAGYGIYYNGQAYFQFGLKLAQQPPFATSLNVNAPPGEALLIDDGFVQPFSTNPAVITNTFAVDRYYRTPYAQTWNFTIQHDLGRGFFMEVGYLGTKGTHLDVLLVPNQGPPGSQQVLQVANATGFTFDEPVGNSILNSFQTHLMRRFRGGISMNAHYTVSKSIDDVSTFGGGVGTVAQNWLDLEAERGLSSFDRRQVFDMTWVVTSPFGNPNSRFASTGWSGRLLRNWTLSGGITAETGTPLTARVLGNLSQLAQTGGSGSLRAEATGIPIESGGGFFNLAAFALPPAGEFGNAGRNTIPGPSLLALNAAFGRSFQFGDTRRRLEFRFEANNVLNQVSFTNVNTVINAVNYGAPSAAAAMRTVDAVVRFRF